MLSVTILVKETCSKLCEIACNDRTETTQTDGCKCMCGLKDTLAGDFV